MLLVLAGGAYAGPGVRGFSYGGDKASGEPTLYFCQGERGSRETITADTNFAAGGRKIVVATHGWFEREPWPRDLALAIRDKIDANEWLCGWFDWRSEAKTVNPRDAAQFARDKAGPLLAEQILKLSKEPKHVHLIAHSAGCWAISEAARIIARQTKASIHLTFLDAYVPAGWEEKKLGDIAEPNRIFWADHYLTRDVTLKVTERWLTHVHNVDISDITPGIKDHEFPRYWYAATVLGEYVRGDRYGGKELFFTAGAMRYGFCRSLEAGGQNWEESIKLPTGNEASALKKPHAPTEATAKSPSEAK